MRKGRGRGFRKFLGTDAVLDVRFLWIARNLAYQSIVSRSPALPRPSWLSPTGFVGYAVADREILFGKFFSFLFTG